MKKVCLILMIIVCISAVNSCYGEKELSDYDKAQIDAENMLKEYSDKMTERVKEEFGEDVEVADMEPYIFYKGGISRLSGQAIYCTEMMEGTIRFNNQIIGIVYDTKTDTLYSNQVSQMICNQVTEAVNEISSAKIIKVECDFQLDGFYKHGYLKSMSEKEIDELDRLEGLKTDTSPKGIVIVCILDEKFEGLKNSDMFHDCMREIYEKYKNEIQTVFVVSNTQDVKELCKTTAESWYLYSWGNISLKAENMYKSLTDRHMPANGDIKEMLVYTNDNDEKKMEKYYFD